jgi:hypothetical protein
MTDAIVGTSVVTAKKLLEEGKLVAVPTETVYGLAGNALNPDAVASIFEVKGRLRFDPIIVHVASWEQAQQYIEGTHPMAAALAKKYWPGPLTLLLPLALAFWIGCRTYRAVPPAVTLVPLEADAGAPQAGLHSLAEGAVAVRAWEWDRRAASGAAGDGRSAGPSCGSSSCSRGVMLLRLSPCFF